MRPGLTPPRGPWPPGVSSLALRLPDVGHGLASAQVPAGGAGQGCAQHPVQNRQQGPEAPRGAGVLVGHPGSCAYSGDGAQGLAESVGVASAPTSSLRPAGRALCRGLALPLDLPVPSAVPYRRQVLAPLSPRRASGLPWASARVQPPPALGHTGLGFATHSSALSLLTCHPSEPRPPNPRQERCPVASASALLKPIRGYPSTLSIQGQSGRRLLLLHRHQWTRSL